MRSINLQKLTSLSIGAMLTASAIAVTAFSTIQESTMIKKLKTSFQSFMTIHTNERLYIQTDKSFYKPGETVWFSAFVRNEQDLKASPISDIVHVELISPKGNVDKEFKLIAENGIAKGDIDLADYVGGIYKLKAYTNFQKNDTAILLAEKEITIQSVVLPRLKMKLDFDKKAYGKGDKVKADLVFTTNENKPIENTKIDYTISANGNPLFSGNATTNSEGKVAAIFTLPKELSTTDVVANFKLNFEGNVEAISRSVPVVLNQIALNFFPESGDMIESVSGTVAFSALNEFQKPADIEGYVFDENDKVVTKFSSLHNGMGNFILTPQTGMTYRAKITKPSGVNDIYTLPDALRNGYTLAVKKPAERVENELQLAVYSYKQDTLSVIAQTRGKVEYTNSFLAQKGWNYLTLNTSKFSIGVSQITLFDSKAIARAERLVFVNAAKQMTVKITPEKPFYKSREKVTLNIRTLDGDGLPLSADLAFSVVDDNLLSFADDKQGTILAKMLLEPELKQKVEEPNFYFDKKEPKSAEALDNLLLTAGWRRYTWREILDTKKVTPNPFLAEVARVKGKIVDSKGKPIEGAKITLTKTKQSIISNKEGEFITPVFFISEESQLSVSAAGFQEQTQNVYDYGNYVNFYLWKVGEPQPVFYRNKGVQMRGGRAEEAEGVMMENMMMAAPMAVNKAADMTMEKGKFKKPLMDMDDAPKNQKEKDVFQNIPDEVLANEDVKDIRFMVKKREDKVIPPLAQYYRAKEFPTRVYTKNDSTRADMATTLFWNGHVTTDQNGKAKVEFIANDLISSFKATAEGFGANGEIGHGESSFITNIPFALDLKMPNEWVAGDEVYIPLFLKNNTDEPVEGSLLVKLPSFLQTKAPLDRKVSIPPHQSQLVSVLVTSDTAIGTGNILVQFKGTYNDQLTRPVTLVAKGFPANISLSAQDLTKTFYIEPKNLVKGSMRVSFSAFPNVMNELLKGVDAILREPSGCFEQTSSSNYPNIMALDYLRKMKVTDKALEEKATRLIESGYKKLVSFETKENGYEWFGASPAHEALTAYGLMQFEDMKKVYPNVDQNMIDRTRKLILDKRDGKGGFVRNPRALDSFGGADEEVTNAYIVYSLTESGYKDLKTELDALYESAKKSKDPYIMALAANAFYNVGDKKRAEDVMGWLLKEQSGFGYWDGKKHSITRSTGDALKIETTSLVALAIMKADAPNQQAIQNGMKYLVGVRNGFGNFGSTQSTILALKALTRFAEFSKKTEESGTVEIYRNDKLIATKSYEKGLKGNVEIEGLESFVSEGKQKIEVRFKGCKNALPYSMNVRYSTSQPQSAKDCVLDLQTMLQTTKTKVGETVRLTTTLRNTTDKGQPMSIAVVGIPAGLSPQPWQLKELQEKKVVDFYEIIGNNIAFYYRALAPSDTKTIALDLKADIAGSYDAAASSAYLYYTNELKVWRAGTKIVID